jgi:hypothetical protein
MSRHKKNYLKIGSHRLPRPPHYATHIKIHCPDKRCATVAIKDVDTLVGTKGKLQYLRLNMKSKKLIETYKDKYNWDGCDVTNFKFDD